MTSDTRPSYFCVCNIEKLGLAYEGDIEQLRWFNIDDVMPHFLMEKLNTDNLILVLWEEHQ